MLVDQEVSGLKIETLCKQLSVLDNPKRLAILINLIEFGECSVSEIGDTLQLKQPGLSQELKFLRARNVVTTRRQSKEVFYTLSDEKIRALVKAILLTESIDLVDQSSCLKASHNEKISKSNLGEHGLFAVIHS